MPSKDNRRSPAIPLDLRLRKHGTDEIIVARDTALRIREVVATSPPSPTSSSTTSSSSSSSFFDNNNLLTASDRRRRHTNKRVENLLRHLPTPSLVREYIDEDDEIQHQLELVRRQELEEEEEEQEHPLFIDQRKSVISPQRTFGFLSPEEKQKMFSQKNRRPQTAALISPPTYVVLSEQQQHRDNDNENRKHVVVERNITSSYGLRGETQFISEEDAAVVIGSQQQQQEQEQKHHLIQEDVGNEGETNEENDEFEKEIETAFTSATKLKKKLSRHDGQQQRQGKNRPWSPVEQTTETTPKRKQELEEKQKEEEQEQEATTKNKFEINRNVSVFTSSSSETRSKTITSIVGNFRPLSAIASRVVSVRQKENNNNNNKKS